MQRSFGMSLIELLIAIAIVAVLSAGAYMNYADNVQITKEVVVKTTLRKYGEALQCYNSDHIGNYTTYDPSHLLGSYTSESPVDPWGADFIVDYFFGRVLSTGQDGVLNTKAPFHPWQALVHTDPSSDDILFQYGRVGKFTFVRGGAVYLMSADGSRVNGFTSSGSRDCAGAGNGSLVLHVASNGRVFLIEDKGEMSEEKELLSPLPTLANIALVNSATDGHEISWSKDLIRFAYICKDVSSGNSAVVVASADESQDPFVLCTAPTGYSFRDAVFDDTGNKVALTLNGTSGREKCIYYASAAAFSTLTTFIDYEVFSVSKNPSDPAVTTGDAITASNAVKYQLAVSLDNRFIAFSDNIHSYLVDISSRRLLKVYPDCTWPVFSPDGQKIAFAYNGGGNSEVIAYHLFKFRHTPIDITDFNTAVLISSLTWN